MGALPISGLTPGDYCCSLCVIGGKRSNGGYPTVVYSILSHGVLLKDPRTGLMECTLFYGGRTFSIFVFKLFSRVLSMKFIGLVMYIVLMSTSLYLLLFFSSSSSQVVRMAFPRLLNFRQRL